MSHIIRSSTLCNTDWCDAKKETERLKTQVALLREALVIAEDMIFSEFGRCPKEITEALEATK